MDGQRESATAPGTATGVTNRPQRTDRSPENLFNAPANLFVAAFIGSPAMNLVEAHIEDGRIHFAGLTLPLPTDRAVPPGAVLLGIRPTDFEHKLDR